MVVEPSTTWLFLRTSPFEGRVMPVPDACPEPTTVLMSTIAGSTLAAIALASRLPLEGAVVGLAIAIGDWTVTRGVLSALARPQPTPMPLPPAAIATTSIETTIPRQMWGSPREGGAGGGGGGGAQYSGAGAAGTAVSPLGAAGWFGSGLSWDMGFTSASCAIWFLDPTMRGQPLRMLDRFLRFAEKPLVRQEGLKTIKNITTDSPVAPVNQRRSGVASSSIRASLGQVATARSARPSNLSSSIGRELTIGKPQSSSEMSSGTISAQ